MESVDRLRNYVEQVCGCNGGRHDIQAIADEIEREHRKALHEAIRNALANGKKSVLRQIADTHMPLPKDADGVPIHVGDVMEGYGKTIEVVELRYGRSGWVLISGDGNGYADTSAFAHHHSPTVVDMLYEMYDRLDDPSGDDRNRTIEEIVTEYAAKLQLREGA